MRGEKVGVSEAGSTSTLTQKRTGRYTARVMPEALSRASYAIRASPVQSHRGPLLPGPSADSQSRRRVRWIDSGAEGLHDFTPVQARLPQSTIRSLRANEDSPCCNPWHS